MDMCHKITDCRNSPTHRRRYEWSFHEVQRASGIIMKHILLTALKARPLLAKIKENFPRSIRAVFKVQYNIENGDMEHEPFADSVLKI